MASSKKRRHRRNANPRVARPHPASDPRRPTPVEAIATKHTHMAEGFGARSDRFSQLMSKLIQDQYAGGQLLVSASGLSDEEHAELESLREGAHASFRDEMVVATSQLRALVAQGDPLYTLAIIQTSNIMAGW